MATKSIDFAINELRLVKEKELSLDRKTKSLAGSKLKDYQVTFLLSPKSIDIPNVWFTNKLSLQDKPLLKQVKHLLSLEGKSVNVDNLPLLLIDNEDTVLYNHLTEIDIFKKARFDKICSCYKIIAPNTKRLKKYPYLLRGQNRTTHQMRIVCFKENNSIDIAFLDIHHLLATKMTDSSEYDRKKAYCDKCLSEVQ